MTSYIQKLILLIYPWNIDYEWQVYWKPTLHVIWRIWFRSRLGHCDLSIVYSQIDTLQVFFLI